MEKPLFNSSQSKEELHPIHYLSRTEAMAIEQELLEEFRFGPQQLIEICGHASAMAITKVFPRWSLPKKQPTLLVVCGCEQNGAIGLVCARHLRVFEYEPTIFYPKPSSNPLYRDFITQCEKMDIPFLSYLPNEEFAKSFSGIFKMTDRNSIMFQIQLISDAYNLVVDAMLGVETRPEEVSEPFISILGSLKQIRIPLISLDIPSGWDVESGNGNGINPDVLISLGAPKQCAMHFMGKHHLIAGRFLPYDMEKKFELNLPEYPGTECVAFL